MGKVKPARRSLRFAGQFERRCRCLLHNEAEQYTRLYRTDSKEYQHQKLNTLIQQNHISPKAKWVCSSCLNYGIQSENNMSLNTMQSESRSSSCTEQNAFMSEFNSMSLGSLQSESRPSSCTEQVISESNIFEPLSSPENTSDKCNDVPVDKVINALNNGLIQGTDLVKLCNAVGKAVGRVVSADISNLSGVYKDNDTLCDLNCKEFLENRPVELTELFNNICGLDLQSASSKKLAAYCFMIEQLYFLKNLNFIGPFSFSQNIIKWTFSGSKASITLDGSTTASGSIATLKKFLQDISVEENKCFSTGDVDVFFDNTQKVGKTRRVRESGTTPMDIATNVVFIQQGISTDYQQNEELIPEEWSDNNSPKISEFHAESVKLFQPYKRKIQGNVLNQVSSEIVYDPEALEHQDHVSVKNNLVNVGLERNVCVKCMHVHDTNTKKCPKCNHDPNFHSDRNALYGDVPSSHNLPAKVQMGEIIGVNPNSRENVKIVLKNILKQCCVGEVRKWVRVGCDGLPYSIADSLIESLVTCCICHEEIDLQKKSFELHVLENHSQSENARHEKVFGSILLTPGAGHIEINLLRSCFAFCKFIFTEHVAQLLGFCSQRAKDFIVNCGNHHLSWQIAMTIFNAFSQELVYTYVLECFKNDETPTLAGFVSWKGNVKNPNIPFYYDLIFNIFLGLKCFRSGIRKNNSLYAISGRQSAAIIFFLGKHIIYQRLICRDLQIRANAPSDIDNYLKLTESYTVSGDSTKGEGGDYITENQNKILKQHLPPGVPTFGAWQIASRCDKKLHKIRESVFTRLSIKDPGSDGTVTLNQDTEVQMLRRVIRSNKIFVNPDEALPLRALDGKQLHEDLLYFMSVANDNVKTYVASGPGCELKPVFTTYAEEAAFNDISTWTIKKISTEIQLVLQSFTDEDLSLVYQDIYKRIVVKQNKSAHVQFLEEVRSLKESVLSDLMVEEENNI